MGYSLVRRTLLLASGFQPLGSVLTLVQTGGAGTVPLTNTQAVTVIPLNGTSSAG